MHLIHLRNLMKTVPEVTKFSMLFPNYSNY